MAVEKDLGKVTAYAYAKAAGYTGTEEQFQQVFNEFTENAPGLLDRLDDAVADAEAAHAAAQTAVTNANTAKNAAEAAQAAAEQTAQDMDDSVQQITTNKNDISDLKETVAESDTEQNEFADWVGFPQNLFDAKNITISNNNNWAINSATKTSISITHKTEFTTGFPVSTLNLPSGTYVFHITNDTQNANWSLKTDNSWVMVLTDGTEFTVDANKLNEVYFSIGTTGTFGFTDIIITKKSYNGKIQTIEAEANIANSNILDLQTGFSDIAEIKISTMTGATQTKKAINASGLIYEAGSTNYCITRYDVNVGKKYWITANTNWGNLLWCFYDSNDAVVQLGSASASSSDDTIITDEEITAPLGASYILVSSNSTVNPGDLKTETGYKIKGNWIGKKWVCVGDSLTAENIRTTKHYFDYVADATGITVVNMGYSGSGYARLANENHAFYQRISSCPTDADVVTIFGSFNDLGAGLDIGTVTDTGTTTLAGCINTTIDNLQAVIPLVNLGIVAPTPWDTTQPSTSGTDYNYVEMLKSICEHRSIPFLDLWRCSNLHPWDSDFRELAYSKDEGSGTHPDENGHKLIAPRFKAFLETLLM